MVGRGSAIMKRHVFIACNTNADKPPGVESMSEEYPPGDWVSSERGHIINIL